jgi:hypothetical protein
LARMRILQLVVGGCLVGLLAGCAAASPDTRAAEDGAVAFHRALDAGDGAAACRLLAPRTLSELEERSDEPCAAALESLDLGSAGNLVGGSAYGLAAQVKFGADTVFLTLDPTGWRVTAAGCSAVPDQPYDCEVRGG